jgi:hypothetical protein
MGWAKHVARIGKRKTCNVFVRELENLKKFRGKAVCDTQAEIVSLRHDTMVDFRRVREIAKSDN